MCKITILFLSLFLSISIYAQTGISQKDIEKIKTEFKKNKSQTKVAANAVSANDIKDLALNRENIGKHDHYFKYKVSVSGITDQHQSGRCWMFTGLNVLRPVAISKYDISKFEFSTNYLYFWDIFEKSNLFLEGIYETKDKSFEDREVVWLLSNVVGDGGVWNSFTNLIGKYGLVPKEIMPETNSSKNTRMMIRMIKRKLREFAVEIRDTKGEDFKTKKLEMLSDIYKMLVINLGEPPSEFNWRYKNKNGDITDSKKYTPLTFMKEVTEGINFEDHIMLMDDPTRQYYKLYEIDKDRNVTEGKNWKYINLPANEIKKFAVESIKANEAMYFSCDVGKQLNSKEGLLSVNNYDYESVYGVKFGMNKKERILTRESGSTHGMALVAVDTDENDKPLKWQLENSWGSTSGHNGYLTMTDKWFDEYMFRLVINKKFIDEKTLNILKQKPQILPPWDPMFKYDE